MPPPKTLQIALLGGDEAAVFVGLRNFPAHKLVLIASPEAGEQAKTISAKLSDTLKLTVGIVEIKETSVQSVLEAIGRLVRRPADGFEDFLINFGSAGKRLACAGVTAAFIYGVSAFDVYGENAEPLPVMRFSYAEAITSPKIAILRAIERAGGQIESLETLTNIMNFGKPLLSYHIRGSQVSRGLESLGLVDIERGKRGRLQVKLTPLGRTLLSTEPA